MLRCEAENNCTNGDLPRCSDYPPPPPPPPNHPDKPKNLGDNCPIKPDNNVNDCGIYSGNPINNSTGNKTQSETDYRGTGVLPLQLIRQYNSQSTISTGAFGANWTFNYGSSIQPVTASRVNVIRGNERTFSFNLVNGAWQGDADVNAKLVQLQDAAGQSIGWRYTTSTDQQETYDNHGHLMALTHRAGLTETLSYDSQGRLVSVTDPFARQLLFAYDTQNRISNVTDPLGGQYNYHYDANNNLDAVTYPDGAVRQYRYENALYPHALTGIVDENGVRFATWSYDGDKAVSSEHAGGVEKVTVNTDMANLTATMQDALGATHQFSYRVDFGVAHAVSESRSCPDCTTKTRTLSYDNQGNLTSSTDFNGVVTQYSYDTARNLETSRTEAAGTPKARTITTQWHNDFRLPSKITSPDGVKTFDYNAQGLLIKRTESSLDGTQSRVWQYAYNANGQITQVDGARTDVSDITQYSYDAKGNLTRITDALGHTTQITDYDAAGHPLTMVDPNGLVTTLTYDPRGRLTAVNKGGEITGYRYDKAGLLQSVSQPDGTRIDYRYDEARRLIGLQNSHGDSVSYTLDALGNRLREEWYNPSHTLTRTLQRQYDGFARVSRELGAQGQTTQYQYDNNDNVVQLTDPLQQATRYQYDALNRLSQETDPSGATTQTQYDDSDRVTQVTDRNHNATQYLYDALGNRTEQHSPDTGTSTARYDAAGNAISRTDANGQATQYQYDALNRLQQARFADGSTVGYQYDNASNGIGRLAAITDSSGSTEWQYDPHGRISSKQHTINLAKGRPQTLISRYRYNQQGQLIEMTYPSGLKVAYGYADGQISRVLLNGTVWLDNISYQPDGRITGWTWADGSQQQRSYDTDGQLISQTLGTGQRTLNYDAAGRITALNDPQTRLNLNYDRSGRLIAANDQHWQYDDNGNRIQQQTANGSTDYQLAPTSNRLLSSSGADYQQYRYDDNGNTLQDNAHSYRYDAQNRLVDIDNGNTASYRYNGQGQRVYKALCETKGKRICAKSKELTFAYDEDGKLLGEYNGNAYQETVWLHNLPIAAVQNTTTYAIHSDHLGTPRDITNAQKKIIRQWHSDPFGSTPANEDPDGDGKPFTYNLRFAGQYYDQETGLHYNYYRDYNPKTGRYLESDPIGLAGGLNTFGYVGGNPVNFRDPSGQYVAVAPGMSIAAGSGVVASPVIAIGASAFSGYAFGSAIYPSIAQPLGDALDKMFNPDPYQSKNIPKPPTGKGAVPVDQRDPKRVFSKDDKQEGLDENGGVCDCCGEELDIDDAIGHHIGRWADGFPTSRENQATVCKPCHKKLHSK